jgi:hypothetical protein
MTILLQTRVPRELGVRFKSAARTRGKSTYQVLRELAEIYVNQDSKRKFSSEAYTDRFVLPSPSGFKAELRRRVQRRYEKHH